MGARQSSLAGALALVVWMLMTACTTSARVGAAYLHHPPPLQASSEALESEVDDGDTGDDDVVFTNLPKDFAPVRVGDSELMAALTSFWLNVPLRVS
ncbi:hypothetical protein [Melittangium boletus]|uniref:Lipoprotein n=1 Tax=Melittangium boletus DSM 14713 TaxID=1294270 RepID=A0A250IKG3_9BACT|nr:hypothetical protein [Melittangium boletus]ATB31681.1 hypothetical protein MEBOL_005144 [Melittangium boletus DSM 14713]